MMLTMMKNMVEGSEIFSEEVLEAVLKQLVAPAKVGTCCLPRCWVIADC